MGCIVLVRCVLVLCYGLAGVVWCDIRMQAEAVLQPAYGYQHSNTTNEITQQTIRKLLRMDVLTSETC